MVFAKRLTHGPTDGAMDRLTDGLIDKASYGVAISN